MVRICRRLILSLAIWSAAVSLAIAGEAGSHRVDRPDPAHQVLVLLRLPAQHFRPNVDYGDSYGDAPGRSARQRIATRLAREHGLTLVTDWPMPLLSVDCYVLRVPADQSPEAVAAALSRDPTVAWAQTMNVYHAQGRSVTFSQPLFPVQPAAREWRLADLHQISTGRDVRVAVIDSMIDKTHPDLIGQVQISENFVSDRPDTPEAHGTGVAGIIAARGVGIVGVAPRARLMALRACWQQNSASTVCDSLTLAKALHFAITHNAQVINLSLSGPPDPLLGKLLDVALAHDVAIVGAFDRDLPGGGFPASHAGVVAVADESIGGTVAGVYNAPGSDVPTTQPGGHWFLVNGNSFAAAHVSGLFALIRERAAHTQGSLDLVTLRPGGGAVDACATLLRASGRCDCACARVRDHSAENRE